MSRRRSRELALETLYELELGGGDLEEVLEALGRRIDERDVADYAKDLVVGVLGRRDEIDGRIRGLAEHWAIERMAAVDRNVIRLACYEILWRDDVPPKAALDEALEVARRYGGESSVRFVNGILDRILAERVRAGSLPGAEPGDGGEG